MRARSLGIASTLYQNVSMTSTLSSVAEQSLECRSREVVRDHFASFDQARLARIAKLSHLG
jgi:hypothetical protein